MLSQSRITFTSFILVALLAILLRLPQLQEDFWVDEISTFHVTEMSLTQLPAWLAEFEGHPPLYYGGAIVWTSVFGHNELALRAYSLFWSLGTLCLIWLWCTRFAARGIALTAVAIYAVAPMDIFYATEARMYAQSGFFALLSSYLLTLWLEEGNARRRRFLLAGYALSALILSGSHYVANSVLVAHGLLVLFNCKRDWTRLREYTVAGVCFGGLFLTWVLYVIGKKGSLTGGLTAWLEFNPGRLIGFPFLHYTFPFAFNGKIGASGSPADSIDLSITGILLCAVIFLLIWAVPFLQKTHPKESVTSKGKGLAVPLFVVITGPLAILFFSLLAMPVFYPQRSGMFYLPLFVIATAQLIFLIKQPRLSAIAGGGLILLWLGSTFQLLATPQRDDLSQRVGPYLEANQVDASILGFPPTALYYMYALPPEANLMHQDDALALLHSESRGSFRLAIFVTRDEREAFNHWPHYPHIRDLVLSADKVESTPISIDTDVHLLTFNELTKVEKAFENPDEPTARNKSN